jgi:hypothetical protein
MDKGIKKEKFNLVKYIQKLNKTALVVIVGVYAIFLFLILAIVTPKRNYTLIPDYEHVFYSQEIAPQISIVGVRTYVDEKISLSYSVSALLKDRNEQESYPITSFRMSASTTTNEMYYFTEHNSYTTPISHSYSMSNSSKDQVPETFFVALQYKKNGEQKAATFKENVMLNFSNSEKSLFGDTNTIKINASSDKSDVRLSFRAPKNTEGNYSIGVKLFTSKEVKYHIDMQTWLVDEEGTALPFIGVYGYTSDTEDYSNTGREVIPQLNAKYLYAKVVYQTQNGTKTMYYMQELSEIAESFQSTENSGENETPEENDNQNDDKKFDIKPYIYILEGLLLY